MKTFQFIAVVLVNAIIAFAIVTYLGSDNTQQTNSFGQSSYRLTNQERNLVDIVQEVNPAVLSIIVSQDVPVYEQYLRNFGPFGFQLPSRREVGTEERQVGSGSGFVVSQDGLVVTNRHVVNVADAEYVGIDSEGRQYNLELIARDEMLDIAVLQMNDVPDNLTYVEFGDSDQLQLGQSVVAIGNALGEFSNTISTGIVSGLSRSLVAGSGVGDSELLENVIQTDAAINPGNSGGPLLNLAGQVIGVNVAVALGSENIGFAIPGNTVKSIVQSIEDTGRIVRPYLGVRYVMLNQVISDELDIDVSEGALIFGSGQGLSVDPDSAAARSGLREGDVIIGIGDEVVGDNQSLAAALRKQPIGQAIDLKYLRNGEEVSTTVTLDEFSESDL